MASKQQPKVPPLTKGPVPLAPLRDKARAKFLDLIDLMIGSKGIVFDPALDGSLGLVIPAAVLAEHGVDEMYHLGPQLVEPQSANVIYISRANVVNAQLIAEQIKCLNRNEASYKYAVYFVPRVTCLCEKLFEDEGVRGDIELSAMPWDLIPFDEDVLSLELTESFRETSVDGDPTALYLMARALMQFQGVIGTIPRVMGKGPAAEAVEKMCTRMSQEMGDLPPPSTIKRMILIDRAVDMVTPLVTQVTYEGIIDEILGIRNNVVHVNVTDRSGVSERKKYILNSNDPMHCEMRDVPWHKAAPKIRDWVQKMKHDWHSIKQDTSSKSVSEMRDFANRLTQLGSTEMHSNISEPIAKAMVEEDFKDRINVERQIIEEGAFEEGYRYVEDLMMKGCDFFIALRLLCLLCITNNGIPKKIIDQLRKTMLLCYGYENVSLMTHLETAGLLYTKMESRSNFPAIRRGLNLSLNEEEDTTEEQSGGLPRDVSHIYWGYAPISIRLVELTLKQHRSSAFTRSTLPSEYFPESPFLGEVTDRAALTGWRGRGMDAVNLLPGAHFDYNSSTFVEPSQRGALVERGETVLVVFLGGVTFSEISALRFLSRLSGGRTKFVIATSHLINGGTFLKAFQDGDVQLSVDRAKKLLIE